MIKKILLIATLLTTAVGINAKEVSQEMATSKAAQLIKSRVDGFEGKVASVKSVTINGKRAYYVVQFEPQGWALISADDNTAPLIGYSPEGIYLTENQPDNVKAQMDIYGEQILENAKTGKQHAGWQTADGMTNRASQRATTKVSPLISVNWNQGNPYRKYCPTGTYVGCVAVGMAQAMTVAKYPTRPTGSHGYDHKTYGWLFINYDEEAAYDWATILSSPSSDNVARLLYQCGVSVDMDYGTDGSGAQSSAIANALKTYFCYPQSVKYFVRSNFANSDWEQMMLTELTEGRAIIYCGHDPKKNYGHCFNLDGYDGTFYHVNWGWGGSNNGYFPLDGLKDVTMDMDYTDGQGAIIGVRAPSEYPSNITLSANSVSLDAPAGTEVATVSVESEATNPTYTFTVVGEYNIVFHTQMPVPFKVENGKLVTTETIDPEYGDHIVVEITVKNNENGHSLTRTFTIKLTNSSGINHVSTDERKGDSFYRLDGQKINTPQKGVNIIRNGKQAKKVIAQ